MMCVRMYVWREPLGRPAEIHKLGARPTALLIPSFTRSPSRK